MDSNVRVNKKRSRKQREMRESEIEQTRWGGRNIQATVGWC